MNRTDEITISLFKSQIHSSGCLSVAFSIVSHPLVFGYSSVDVPLKQFQHSSYKKERKTLHQTDGKNQFSFYSHATSGVIIQNGQIKIATNIIFSHVVYWGGAGHHHRWHFPLIFCNKSSPSKTKWRRKGVAFLVKLTAKRERKRKRLVVS